MRNGTIPQHPAPQIMDILRVAPGVGKKPSKSNSSTSSSTNNITQEHRNALSKAERYYHNQDLSKSQVREQLEYEGYEKDAIDYAMKNLT